MSLTTTPPSVAAPDRPVREGVTAVAPMALGVVPFALVIGTAIADHRAGFAGWAGSWLIYGGSAHLAALRVLDTSGAAVAVLTGLLVNARLLVYSASLGQRWRHQPRWFRLIAATLVIDPTWALAMGRPPRSGSSERRWFFAAGLTLGMVWSATMAVGVLFGGHLHLAAFEVVAPLCLVALVAPRLVRADERPVIAVAAVVAVATRHLPAGTGLLAAVAAGWAAGELVERRSTRGAVR
jgi:predicted branched-subunit amino acid permease